MDKVYDYLSKELKIKANDTLVLAISGGPDSMALLHLMITLRKSRPITLVCAHVNHNVRKESLSEQKTIQKYCQKNDVIFETMTISEYSNENFHSEARSIRYKYFEEIVNKYKAEFLMTAHHGDDLIETILMRIVRGSSLRGYSGFAKESKSGNYRVVRPLIGVTKDELLNYCNQNKIPFALDKSNKKDKYTRNRFRKYLLPVLKKEDANVHAKFLKFSRVLNEYDRYVEGQTRTVIEDVYSDNTIDIAEFLKQDPLIQKRILNNILEDLYNSALVLIGDVHVELLLNLINSNKANASIELPSGITAVKAYNTIVLSCDKKGTNSYFFEFNDILNLPNDMKIERIDHSEDNSNNVCYLNSQDILMPLYVRTRNEGDRMSVKGMIGHKKINDIFVDQKISTQDRDLWPIVVDSNDNIVWLPGLKKSKVNKSKNEKYDIILKYY